MFDADLAHERDYVAGLYARLDELREEKRTQLAQVRRAGAVGTMQNVSERDAFAALYEDRLAQLDAVDDRLVFGRLDLDSGEAQYIGRIGLTTDDLQRLMVDWRAPEAGHFYQATAFDRQGVRRRRHLILQGREVKAIEDDVLDAGMLADNESLQGEGALLAALNSKRTGRMSDIVGTIQSEQDRIIRSSISGAVVVQGGPGTGKTAVALHRAAYLLYTHRDRLKTAGVLLVGPSSSFMKYIERVLPSLGETGVVMASVGRLMPGINAVPEQEADVAAVKGRLSMAEVVANAVSNRQRIPAENRILDVDGRKLVLTPRQVRRAREKARATAQAAQRGARDVREDPAPRADRTDDRAGGSRQHRQQRRPLVSGRGRPHGTRCPDRTESLLDADDPGKAHLRAVQQAGHPGSLHPDLTDAERALLSRPADSPWTEADVPLLDEAAELLGELDPAAGRGLAQQEHDRARDIANAKQTLVNMETAGVDVLMTAEELVDQNQEREARLTAAERATSDRTWAFGHIVVDEAQELSPMQWRLLVRRCPLKSFTIVGDIAQTSSVAGANSWQGALEPMFGDRWQLEELTVNYRTPSQIAEAAARMATAAGLVVSAPKAVREGRWSPIIDRVDDGSVVSRLVEVLPDELDALDGGLLAVIADGDLLPQATSALRAAYGRRVGTGAGSYEQDIVVISPREAKGLEFDGVVVLEPSMMLNHEHGRVGDLYVAMTRPTQRLRLIAAAPVPAGIER